jgi:hypothetical protein
MRKILVALCLLIGFNSFGQYQLIQSRYDWLAGKFRALNVPGGTTPIIQVGQTGASGALYVDTTGADSGFYYSGPNQVFHRLSKYGETFYRGNGTFSSNRTVTGAGFSLGFSGLSTFTLGSTGLQSFNANGGVGVRSDIYLYPDSILIQPHDGKINIDSLRSGHPTDTTTYKPMVWSPTNKSWRYLTGWPGGGGTPGGANTNIQFNNSGAFGGSADFTWDGNTIIGTSSSGIGTHGLQLLNDNVGSNSMILGFTNTNFNAFEMYYNHVSGGSLSNTANFGMRGASAYGISIDGNSNVGIQDMTPEYALDVTGVIRTKNHIVLNDVSFPSTPTSGTANLLVNDDRLAFESDNTGQSYISTYVSTSVTNASAPTPPAYGRTNEYYITSLANSIAFGVPGGTLRNGNKLLIRIKDNGTARAITWDAIYRAGTVTLPSTTIVNKTMYLGFIYNSADSKWDIIANEDNY